MVNPECAVTFVSFCNKIISHWLPMRIRTQDRDLSPHIVRRVQATDPKNMRCHRRGRGLAVHPGNHNPFFDLHNRGQCFRTPHQREFQPDRFIESRIPSSDCGRIDYELSAANSLLCLREIKPYPERLKPPRLKCTDSVASA